MPDSGHRRRDAVSFRLGSMLILAVLAFDCVSVLAPELAGSPIGAGGNFTLGILCAFLIVAAVVVAAAYYTCWLKHEDPPSQSVTGTHPD